MPAVSKAQNAAMQAAASGHSTLGIPQSVGQEFAGAEKPGMVKALPARAHALSMASATHLHNAGHISTQMRDAIHEKARAGIASAKGGMPAPQAPRPFGALAPAMPSPMGGAPPMPPQGQSGGY